MNLILVCNFALLKYACNSVVFNSLQYFSKVRDFDFVRDCIEADEMSTGKSQNKNLKKKKKNKVINNSMNARCKIATFCISSGQLRFTPVIKIL